MNLGQLHQNEGLREKLASEYVLGTLRGRARQRFEKWLEQDQALRVSVYQWQDRLHPLAELAAPAQPSPAVWEGIAQQIGLPRAVAQPTSRRNFWHSLRTDLSFWRGLGMTSTALASILAVVLMTQTPDTLSPIPSYVATLADERMQPVVVVTGNAEGGQLIVKLVEQTPVPPDKSLELWALPKDGQPRSLGLLAAGKAVVLPLPENLTPDKVPALAVSLEPRGGSPNPNAPSGPVLYKGPWLRV